jgi:hypothetical protein
MRWDFRRFKRPCASVYNPYSHHQAIDRSRSSYLLTDRTCYNYVKKGANEVMERFHVAAVLISEEDG